MTSEWAELYQWAIRIGLAVVLVALGLGYARVVGKYWTAEMRRHDDDEKRRR